MLFRSRASSQQIIDERLPSSLFEVELEDADHPFPGDGRTESDRSRLSEGHVSGATLLEGELDEMKVLGLIRRLRDPDEGRVAEAERVLEEIGFTALEFELARRLTDTDVKVRQQLLDSLADLAGIRMHEWLFFFTHDENADLRLRAATLLATTPGAQVEERLMELTRDTNSRVARQAKHLLEQYRSQR